jgi:FkbM family methyltransferase
MRDHLGDELRFILRGASTRDRWRILRILGHLHLRTGRARALTKYLPRRSSAEFDLQLRDGPRLRLRPEDIIVVLIYGALEYDLDFSLLGRVTSMLDLGANVGLDAIDFADRLGVEQVFCVEASGDNFRLLEKNLARNLPGARAIHAAAVGQPGAYHVEEGAEPGEIRVLPGEGSVEALTLPEILDRAGMDHVDLLKIDIEGAEAEIFERAEEWGHRVGAVIGEVHPPLTRERAYEQLAEVGLVPLSVGNGVPDDIIYARRTG